MDPLAGHVFEVPALSHPISDEIKFSTVFL